MVHFLLTYPLVCLPTCLPSSLFPNYIMQYIKNYKANRSSTWVCHVQELL